ncbi:hypothetical protein OROGR_002167 [Orobanche gracilis]
MRSIEDKGCLNNASAHKSSDGLNFEFQKCSEKNRTSHQHHHHHHHNRTALGKQTPSKWDDAQKWLANLSRGEKNHPKASPRNSNADDRRLIAPVPKKDYSSGEDDEEREKNVISNSPRSAVRQICLRDTGTEMTPIASQEPSRAATPVRAASPMPSGSSTPIRGPNVKIKTGQNAPNPSDDKECGASGDAKQLGRDGEGSIGVKIAGNKTDDDDGSGKMNSMEIRAMAWEEAERANHTARFKREEVKIQAWENHQKRKAEMENRIVEVKAERMRSRAQEKYKSKLASARRIAEEKRANAEAKLQQKAMRTCERADYIRRTGHLPGSCHSSKLSSFCGW